MRHRCWWESRLHATTQDVVQRPPQKTWTVALGCHPRGPVVILLDFEENALPADGWDAGLTVAVVEWAAKTSLQPSTLTTSISAFGVKPRRQRSRPSSDRTFFFTHVHTSASVWGTHSFELWQLPPTGKIILTTEYCINWLSDVFIVFRSVCILQHFDYMLY